jgi:5-methylcytosine-specific restriction endonuclease McrA
VSYLEHALPVGDRDDTDTAPDRHVCDRGWLADDDEGRPRPCPTCRPALVVGRPCLGCGQPVPGRFSRCPTCAAPVTRRATRRADARRGKTAARGYDNQWRVLSEKARALQPFCSDCNGTEDLTVDHSPEAWARRARGLPIRLRDVDVLCRPCNARRGAARGTTAPQGETPEVLLIRPSFLGREGVTPLPGMGS